VTILCMYLVFSLLLMIVFGAKSMNETSIVREMYDALEWSAVYHAIYRRLIQHRYSVREAHLAAVAVADTVMLLVYGETPDTLRAYGP